MIYFYFSTKIVNKNSISQKYAFVPPGIEITSTSLLGEDYFDNIDDVANVISKNSENSDDITKNKNPDEKQNISGQENVMENYSTRLRRRSTRSLIQNVERKEPQVIIHNEKKNNRIIDESWKEGNKIFIKRSSSIGIDYQVSFLPSAGSYLDEGGEGSEC